ncbi:MAG: DUF2062 domain-containing protein [Lentisphaeria bacterium]|nr:DUF2062 domain-containing protein [Lentisphaeria bacterium]
MLEKIKKPRGRFGRCMRYYYLKAIREKGTPEYIARGWAIGMFVGFAIPFGLQLLVSIPLAFLMKGSKLGATVGTMATNHFTIWLIYPFQCWLGILLMGGDHSFEEVSSQLEMVIRNQDYETLFGLGKMLIIGFFLGGFLLAAVTTPITYVVVRKIVIGYRHNQLKRRARKQKRKRKHKNA